jgi:hypothetical protein
MKMQVVSAVMDKPLSPVYTEVMIRIKLLKSKGPYKAGETVQVTRNEAHALIDGGYGMIAKDMTSADYRQGSSLKIEKREK